MQLRTSQIVEVRRHGTGTDEHGFDHRGAATSVCFREMESREAIRSNVPHSMYAIFREVGMLTGRISRSVDSESRLTEV